MLLTTSKKLQKFNRTMEKNGKLKSKTNELCKTLTFSKHIYIEDKLILNNKLY